MKPIAGASVLLLEDEYLIAMDAAQILTDLGVAHVRTAGTLEEAEQAIESETFDVAMLDMNINGRMSVPLAQSLWARGVPVIFATGYERRCEGFPEFAVYISKPYTAERLHQAFADALGRRDAEFKA